MENSPLSSLPVLFKVQLAALLARHSSSLSWLKIQCCELAGLGMKTADILDLIRSPLPTNQEMSRGKISFNGAAQETWPAGGSKTESDIFRVCVMMALRIETAQEQKQLRVFLGNEKYDQLISFFSATQAQILWWETHPELAAQQDVAAKIEAIEKSDPQLKKFFAECQAHFQNQLEVQLMPGARFSKINHDIRAPLGVMMGFIELLKEPDLNVAEIPQFASILERNAHQLLQVIDEFANKRTAPQQTKKETSENSLEGLDILIVDDSPDNQYIMNLFLSETGAHIEIASDGKEGIEKTLSGKFDVVLMDIQMPGMDGHEATRTLRAKGYTKPIIALTAHSIGQEGDRCQRSGFSSFLSKPIEKESLKSVLQKYHVPRSLRH